MLQRLIDTAMRARRPLGHRTAGSPLAAGGRLRPAGLSRPALAGAGEGAFAEHAFSNAAGTRPYWLYVPRGWRASRVRAMVVMLHGCGQSPEDFAAGTRMNALAEEHGLLVVYPGQTLRANRMRCWNWYQPDSQQPDTGEPSLIAGITLHVARLHGVDAQRIYVAGLSAGASMAVIMGATYPDLYAAVGVHSGMPYRAARDLWSAVSAMKTGRAATAGWPAWQAPEPAAADQPVETVPTIVFHGSEDAVVHPRNGSAVVRQARAHEVRHGRGRMRASMQRSRSPDGQAYTRTTYADADGQPLLEHWLVHGAGHAWSGGSAQGAYTESRGPDASREMIRFFSAFPRPAPSQAALAELRGWMTRVAGRLRRRQ